MTDVLVNGVARTVRPGCTVDALVAELVPSPKGVAVAIDREVVPRSAWASTTLDGARVIEIVTAAAGG